MSPTFWGLEMVIHDGAKEMIMRADGIVLTWYWETSTGAQDERSLAERLGKEIHKEDEDDGESA